MILKSSNSYHPWIYFFLFLGVDSYLSYVPSNDSEKYLVFLFGILAPALMVLFSKSHTHQSTENIFKKEQFYKSAAGIWVFLGLLFMGLRFWKLTTLFQWPTGDEASIGMLAIGLIRQWNWHFFHGFAQIPFSFHWACYFSYKIFHSSKLALWFLPAVISALLIPLTYLGARHFCGSSFSIVLAGLMAVSFWPMYLGRIGFPIFLLLWELTALYFLLLFLECLDKNSDVGAAAGLGFITGLGPWTATSWMVIAVFIISTATLTAFIRKKFLPLFVFLFLMMITLSLFFVAAWREGYGQHLQSVGFWNGNFDWKDQINRFFEYWMILWGAVDQEVAYATPGGGVLNPILAALFFLGLIEIFIRFSKFYLFLFLLVLTFFLSPGFLSWSLGTYRILAAYPLLLLAAALGLKGLLNFIPPNKAVLIAGLILISSFTLDFYRLTMPYSNPDDRPELFETTGRSYEKYCAGRILENYHKLYGPGLIYTDFVPSATDESLAFTTYPYNCAWNPDAAQEIPRWAALFTDSHYQPFLAKHFSLAKWIVIPTADHTNDDHCVLGIIPITPQTLPIFRSWQTTYLYFMNINLRFLDKPDGKSGEDILEDMIRFYSQIPADPFLQSVYLEKFMDAYERQRILYKGKTEFNYYSYRNILDSSLKKGYPDALVFFYAGRLLIQEGQLVNARSVLKKAVQFDPGNDLALKLFRALKKSTLMVPEK
jgi:hypothetical protein